MEKMPTVYVLSTHWDREWYSHFQDFRYRLVRLMDRTIGAIESGELKGPFYSDGQSIVLTDYLEIRPERTATVKGMLADGRIKSGPWYVMPDEAIVSGESLVRNLEFGRALVSSLGGVPSNSGFVCDIFGHISQLPQIFDGFGIGCAYVWRGINPPDQANFNWVASDGTSIAAYKFSNGGYCDFGFRVRFKVSADSTGEECGKLIDEYLEHETGRARLSGAPAALMFDGADHLEFGTEVNAALTKRDDVIFGSLDDYTDRVRDCKFPITVTGELREAGDRMDDRQWLIPGVLSSRVWIKQRNSACETALTRRAEPISMLGSLLTGMEYPAGFLKTAWRWLLENHPHDSICGCSIDEVHRNMEFRFSQTEAIAHRLSEEAARVITCAVKLPGDGGQLRVGLFNSMPETWTAPLEIDLEIPASWPTFNEFFDFEPLPSFRIFDAEGNEVPYWRISKTLRNQHPHRLRQYYGDSIEVVTVRVAVRVDIPAGGYKVLCVRPAEGPTRHAAGESMIRSARVLDNGVIRAEFEADGTITVTDSATGRKCGGWLRFEDIADIGDGWYHGIAANDRKIYSNASELEVVTDTPLEAVFRVRTEMTLPEAFDFRDMTRSERTAKLVIVSDVTLRSGSDSLEIVTRIDNNICDHRLRVLFPSGASEAKEYFASSAFDTVVRPIALRDGHAWRELPVETAPHAGWFAVADRDGGAAVIAPELRECAVIDDEPRTLALTLYRSTCRTVGTRGEPDGELLRPLEFRYVVAPLSGGVNPGELTRKTAAFAAGVFCTVLDDVDLKRIVAVPETLPAEGRGLEIVGDLAVTALRQVDGGEVEVRVFNPGFRETAAKFRWPKPFASCRRVRLDGTELAELGRASDSVELTVEPKRIVTLRFRFA